MGISCKEDIPHPLLENADVVYIGEQIRRKRLSSKGPAQMFDNQM